MFTGIVEAVSYTHLDVYKRQRQRNARLLYSGMDENYGAVMPYNFCLVVS